MFERAAVAEVKKKKKATTENQLFTATKVEKSEKIPWRPREGADDTQT